VRLPLIVQDLVMTSDAQICSATHLSHQQLMLLSQRRSKLRRPSRTSVIVPKGTPRSCSRAQREHQLSAAPLDLYISSDLPPLLWVSNAGSYTYPVSFTHHHCMHTSLVCFRSLVLYVLVTHRLLSGYPVPARCILVHLSIRSHGMKFICIYCMIADTKRSLHGDPRVLQPQSSIVSIKGPCS
jgi:hypothetical protein